VINLYTYKQVEAAFMQGRRKGQSDIAGTEWEWGTMLEYIKTLEPTELDMDVYESVMRKMKSKRSGRYRQMTYRAIIASVTQATHEVRGAIGVSYSELITHNGNRRNPDAIATPRMLCYYLCYLYTNDTYSGIGKIFGKRKHDTILKGARKIHHWMTGRTKDGFVCDLHERALSILHEQDYDTTPLERKVKIFKPLND